jgi:hypothetical protein
VDIETAQLNECSGVFVSVAKEFSLANTRAQAAGGLLLKIKYGGM